MRIRSNFTDTKFIYIYDLKFQLIIIKNINNNNNNNRDLAVDISWGGSSCPNMFPCITQISKVGFSGGRKTWGAWAKPSEKGQQTTTNTTYKCRNVTQALAVGGVCRSCTCSLGNSSSTYKI